VRNFRSNFKDFSGAFDLKEGLIGARWSYTCLYFIHKYFVYVLLTSPHIRCPRRCPRRRLCPCRWFRQQLRWPGWQAPHRRRRRRAPQRHHGTAQG
jgi:hypothetical protein